MYKDLIDSMVIVRSSQSGVWMGRLQLVEGDDARLQDARRAWNWKGAASCSGLASSGPSGGKICEPVPIVVIKNFCEVLSVTPKALERWAAVSPWIA